MKNITDYMNTKIKEIAEQYSKRMSETEVIGQATFGMVKIYGNTFGKVSHIEIDDAAIDSTNFALAQVKNNLSSFFIEALNDFDKKSAEKYKELDDEYVKEVAKEVEANAIWTSASGFKNNLPSEFGGFGGQDAGPTKLS